MAYIKKEPIVEFITKGLNNPDKTKAYGYDAIEILTEIEYAPEADVEEVVRCKDCTYYAPLGDAYEYKGKKAMHCILRASCTGDNYYCADGMRKEKR